MRKAIVMAGGQGSRLWPLTLTRPKPLVRVVNEPIMAHILEWLRRHGFSDVLITLHYRAGDICREFGDGRAYGLNLTYRVEDEPLGTAGSVKFAEDWIDGESFLIVSGDVLTDVDLTAFTRRHREAGAWLTLGLKQVCCPVQYGVVQLDDQGRVICFQEKPERHRAISRLANTGIYCVEPPVLERVPRGQPYDWSHDVFPQLMSEGLPLYGCELDGYWCDIGSIHDYRRGQRDALEGAVQVRIPGIRVPPGVWIGEDTQIAPNAVVEGPALLGARCRVERDALVLPGTILGEDCVVRAGTCVWGAVLGTSCRAGPNAVVRDCVIDDAVEIGPAVSISEGAVVGCGCRLGKGVRIDAGRRVEPDQVLHEERPGAVVYASRTDIQGERQRSDDLDCEPALAGR